MQLKAALLILCVAAGRKFLARALPPYSLEALWLMVAARLLLPQEIGIPVKSAGGGIFAENVLLEVPGRLYWGGLGILLLALAGNYARFYWRLRDKKAFRHGKVKVWMQKYDCRSCCPVFISRSVASPLAYGLAAPKIILAQREYSDSELEHILLHEWMHIRRGDLWKKSFMAAAVLLNWYNPACWLMLALFSRDIELGCDASVLRILPEGKRAEYAGVLLDGYSKMNLPAATGAGFLGGGLQERIYHIMKKKKVSKKAKGIAARLLCAMFLTAFAKSAEQEEVPDLRGMTEQEAKAVLQEHHLGYSVEDR